MSFVAAYICRPLNGRVQFDLAAGVGHWKNWARDPLGPLALLGPGPVGPIGHLGPGPVGPIGPFGPGTRWAHPRKTCVKKIRTNCACVKSCASLCGRMRECVKTCFYTLSLIFYALLHHSTAK